LTDTQAPVQRRVNGASDELHALGGQLGLWLLALRSFFHTHNHPLSDAERSALLERDFSREGRIARQCLLHATRLALQVSRGDGPATLELARSLQAAQALCDSLLQHATMSFQAWNSLGHLYEQSVGKSATAQVFMQTAEGFTEAQLPPPLRSLLRRPLASPAFDADAQTVFVWIARLRARLDVIEDLLQRDQPLKQSLPVFTLVHQETRRLLDFLQDRVLAYEGVNPDVYDTFDGTAYAIQMEMRKVFSHELVGFSALRPAPASFAKVETAHGLLRNSLQESTVVLARLYEPALESDMLFNEFQTRLQQSLTLRQDLWQLLQLLQRAERERDMFPIARLVTQLEYFRANSLRFLMYKDLESCERFTEEVTMAHGAVELAPVLHRFAAYVETLLGQVNMRGVLANYPFDYPAMED
jgi:hypothetical protein